MKKNSLLETYGLKPVRRFVYAGRYRGLPMVLIEPNNQSANRRLYVGVTAEGLDDALESMNVQFAEDTKNRIRVERTGSILCFTLKPKLLSYPMEDLEQVFMRLKALREIPSCVPMDFRGAPDDGSMALYQCNQSFLFLTAASAENVRQHLEEEKEILKTTPVQFWKGLFAALLAALLAGGLWLLLGLLNLYGWTAGALGVFLVLYAFRRFGKRLNAFGVVLSLLLLIIVLVAASYMEYAIRFYRVLKDLYPVSFWEVLQGTPEILGVSAEIRHLFLRDILLGLGIGFLLSFLSFRRWYQIGTGSYFWKVWPDF